MSGDLTAVAKGSNYHLSLIRLGASGLICNEDIAFTRYKGEYKRNNRYLATISLVNVY